jgi:hypothetical protein
VTFCRAAPESAGRSLTSEYYYYCDGGAPIDLTRAGSHTVGGMEREENGFKPPEFPLHSLIVHILVATWSCALLFDALSRLRIGDHAMVSFFSIVHFGI